MSFSATPSPSTNGKANHVKIPKYCVHKGSGERYVNAHSRRL